MAQGEAAKEAARTGAAAAGERLQPEPLDAVALQLVGIQAALSSLQNQVQSALVLVQMQLGRRAATPGQPAASGSEGDGRPLMGREGFGFAPRKDPTRTFGQGRQQSSTAAEEEGGQ